MVICNPTSVNNLGLLKAKSIQSHNSVNFINRLIEIVDMQLLNLFGILGSREFTIDGFHFDNVAEMWDIMLTRQLNGNQSTYRMTIDNDTGELFSFEKR